LKVWLKATATVFEHDEKNLRAMSERHSAPLELQMNRRIEGLIPVS